MLLIDALPVGSARNRTTHAFMSDESIGIQAIMPKTGTPQQQQQQQPRQQAGANDNAPPPRQAPPPPGMGKYLDKTV